MKFNNNLHASHTGGRLSSDSGLLLVDEKEVIATDTASIRDFAVNGALFYGKHIAKETNFKKIIAIGISGNEKHHEISPIFVDERGNYKELQNLETFISFSPSNIQEYYIKEILEEDTDKEKVLKYILKDAQELHEDLRNYGAIQDKDKPLIVSGILLALREIEYGGFSIDFLTGDTNTTDAVLYDALYLVGGSNLSKTFKKETKKFLNKTFDHFKAIGATQKGVEILEKMEMIDQPGVVTGKETFAKDFIQAIAKYRHRTRQVEMF